MNGKAALAGLAGAAFVWSALEGRNITYTIQQVIQGKKPVPGPMSAPVSTASLPVIPGLPGGNPGAGGTVPTVTAGWNSPAGKVTPKQAYQALIAAGFNQSEAITLTAIGAVESGWNTTSLNPDSGTGDYSVGVWQINYFGSLYASRAPILGTPDELRGNLAAQARAARILFEESVHANESGFQPWMPDITSGKIDPYLGIAQAAAGV